MRLPVGLVVARRMLLWTMLLGAALSASAGRSLTVVGSASNIRKYEMLEFRIEVPGSYANPFDPEEVQVDLEVTRAGDAPLVVPAFYGQDYEWQRLGEGHNQRDWFYPKGQPGWRARFTPTQTGAWHARATLKDRTGTAVSDAVHFESGPSPRLGFIRVSRRDPRFLEFSEGRPFFPIGQNLAFIGSAQYVTVGRAQAVFARLGTAGANYLRVWTCCEDWALALEARKSAWGRSWDWRPPIVPVPEGPASGRRCVRLPSEPKRLEVSPSHPLALRPATRYAVAGQVRTDPGASVRLEAQGAVSERLASDPPGQWRAFRHEFTTGPNDFWLTGMNLRLEGTNQAWLADLSLQEAAGGPELLWEAAVNRPARGYYNPLDCFMLDVLVGLAERSGLYLQLCLLTRDLYMEALKDPASPEYRQAATDAKKLLRYAVARWGYSTSVAAWEYFNEMNPGLPTDAFYQALGEFLEQWDVHRHLRTTSTWGPAPKDCRHPKLDVADVHFYLRPSDSKRLRHEVDAVLDRTRFLREHAPVKPVHLGEFGLADEQWRITDELKRSPELADVHNALWASALSGASGTVLPWWWERLDQHQGDALYQPLSRFLADVPWNSGTLVPLESSPMANGVRVLGLRAGQQAWVWLYDPEASWNRIVLEKKPPLPLPPTRLELLGLPAAPYHVRWWDPRTGQVRQEDTGVCAEGKLPLVVPGFTRDLAGQVGP